MYDGEGVLGGVPVGVPAGEWLLVTELDGVPVCEEDGVPVCELERVPVREEDGVPV